MKTNATCKIIWAVIIGLIIALPVNALELEDIETGAEISEIESDAMEAQYQLAIRQEISDRKEEEKLKKQAIANEARAMATKKSAQGMYDLLMGKIEESKKSQESYKNRISYADKVIQQSEAKVAQAKEQYKAEQEKVAALNARLKEQRTRLAQLAAEQKLMNRMVAAQTHKLAIVKKSYEASAARAVELQKSNQTLAKRAQSLQAANKALGLKNQAARAELRQRIVEQRRAQTDIKRLQASKVVAERQMASTQYQLKRVRARVKADPNVASSAPPQMELQLVRKTRTSQRTAITGAN